ncbi:MAG: hypothetical protein EB149_03050 [Thaumarchaeota archaeon]|nr:hypothetical protein [Nitrososphaerota archaeon]
MTSIAFFKKKSTDELHNKLEFLINDFDQISKQLELLEIKKTIGTNKEPDYDTQLLVQKQNVISFEILKVRKQIKKIQNKFLLKVELALLPGLVVLVILSLLF